jgi:hypothetical protein
VHGNIEFLFLPVVFASSVDLTEVKEGRCWRDLAPRKTDIFAHARLHMSKRVGNRWTASGCGQPCLGPKIFKILCHIECLDTCIKY